MPHIINNTTASTDRHHMKAPHVWTTCVTKWIYVDDKRCRRWQRRTASVTRCLRLVHSRYGSGAEKKTKAKEAGRTKLCQNKCGDEDIHGEISSVVEIKFIVVGHHPLRPSVQLLLQRHWKVFIQVHRQRSILVITRVRTLLKPAIAHQFKKERKWKCAVG